jgi:hypothetical protein
MNLEAIEADVWEKASVNRDHILEWLKLQPSSDGATLKADLADWLKQLHANPKFTKVNFHPEGDLGVLGVNSHPIQRILDDLESYGYVTRDTILETQ